VKNDSFSLVFVIGKTMTKYGPLAFKTLFALSIKNEKTRKNSKASFIIIIARSVAPKKAFTPPL